MEMTVAEMGGTVT